VEFHLDNDKVRRSFERAAQTYDGASVVQRHMADELIDRLDYLNFSPTRILDAGCGTGYAMPGLMQRYPEAEFLLLDFALPMLQGSQSSRSGGGYRICADVQHSPLAAQSVDMVFCNSVLEWCEFGTILTEFRRVLKPDGLLTFATFGPDTLVELRNAWRRVDEDIHAHPFKDMHDMGDALVDCQFITPVMDVDYLTVTYKDLKTALEDLRKLGAANAASERSRGLTGKDKFQEFERATGSFRNDQGLLACTCEIVYGHAWAPRQTNLGNSGGAVAVPLDQLRRSRGRA